MEKKFITEAIEYGYNEEANESISFTLSWLEDISSETVAEYLRLANLYACSYDGDKAVRYINLNYVIDTEDKFDSRCDLSWEETVLRLYGTRLETDREFNRRVRKAQAII